MLGGNASEKGSIKYQARVNEESNNVSLRSSGSSYRNRDGRVMEKHHRELRVAREMNVMEQTTTAG